MVGAETRVSVDATRPTDGPSQLAVATVNQVSERSVVAPFDGEVSHDADFPRVLRKTLRAQAFSHVETRDEFLTLEYTPYFVEAPVDLRYPSRLMRLQRSPAIVFGIVVPAGASHEGLEATLHGIAENVRVLTRLGWEWTSMAVVIVVDGLETLTAAMVDYLHGVLKLLEPSLLSHELKGETVHLHVFERTVELTKHSQAREYYDPLQVTLAVTSDQCGDMKSHMWLFNAFCQQMHPNFVFTFAAGAIPLRKACLRMLDAFDASPQTAIVVPETHVPSSSIFHPLVMLQLFVTKFTNSTVTPFHSLFGFTPNAGPVCAATGTKHCIALRWPSIPADALGKFFKCQEVPIIEAGPLAANRFMTPLNILCWETHRAGAFKNQVVFEPAATVHVDVPQGLLSFMNLQRIEHNGDFFNSLYYLYDAPRAMLFGDGTVLPQHACGSLLQRVLRLPLWLIQYLQVLLTVLGSWFTVGAFYLVLHYVAERALVQSKFQLSNGVIYGFKFAFVLLVVGQIIASLGMELGDMRLLYTVIACVYGVGFSLVVVMAVWVGIHSRMHPWLLYGIAVCFGGNLLAVTIAGNLYSIAKSALQFVFTAPIHLFMVPIHALATCNDVAVHRRVGIDDTRGPASDVLSPTFATGRFPKGLDGSDAGIIDNSWDASEVHNLLAISPSAPSHVDRRRLIAGRRRFSSFRTRILVLWLACNWLLASFFLSFHFSDLFPWAVIGFGVLMTLSRVCGAIAFHCGRFLRRMCWLVRCRRHTAVSAAKPHANLKPLASSDPQPPFVSHPRDVARHNRQHSDASFRSSKQQREESLPPQHRENSFTSQSPTYGGAVESRAAVSVAASQFMHQRDYPQYTVTGSGSEASLRGLPTPADVLSRPPSEARTVLSRELRDAEDAVQAIAASTHVVLQQTSHVQASNRRLVEGQEPLFERSVSDRRGSRASSHRRLSDVVTHSEPVIVVEDVPSRGRKISDGASVSSDHRSVSPLLASDSQSHSSQHHQQRPSLVALAMRSGGGKSLDSAASGSLDISRGPLPGLGGIRGILASSSAVQHLATGNHTSSVSIAVTASLAGSPDTPLSPRRSTSPGRQTVNAGDSSRGRPALAPVQSQPHAPVKLGFLPRTPGGGSSGHLDGAHTTPSQVAFTQSRSDSVKSSVVHEPSPDDAVPPFIIPRQAQGFSTHITPLDGSDMHDTLQRAAALAMELNMDVQQPLQTVLDVSSSLRGKRVSDPLDSQTTPTPVPLVRDGSARSTSKPPIQPRLTPQGSGRTFGWSVRNDGSPARP